MLLLLLLLTFCSTDGPIAGIGHRCWSVDYQQPSIHVIPAIPVAVQLNSPCHTDPRLPRLLHWATPRHQLPGVDAGCPEGSVNAA